MSSTRSNTIYLTCKTSPALRDALATIAEKSGSSLAAVMREALTLYVDNPTRTLPPVSQRAQGRKTPVYEPPRAVYRKPILGDVGALSTTLIVAEVHELYRSPLQNMGMTDLQARASKALGRPVRGAAGVVVAILAARYCMPVRMRAPLTPFAVRAHRLTLRGKVTRQLKMFNVPECHLEELSKESKAKQVFHPQLLRAIVAEALVNPAAAFPEGLRIGPSMPDAYAMRPVWMDGSPHAALKDIGADETAETPETGEAAAVKDEPAAGTSKKLHPRLAHSMARMRARIAENRRREAKGLPWLTANERAPGEPDPLPEAERPADEREADDTPS
jgi:hypothetical protein